MMFKDKLAEAISSLLPTDAMMEIFSCITKNTLTITKVGFPCVVIIAWLVISIILFQFRFNYIMDLYKHS